MTKLKLLDIGSANPRLDEGWNKLKNVQIVMFEPDQRSFDQLIKNRNNDSYIAFNYALDKTNGKRKLYLTVKPELTSFYKPKTEYHNLFPNSDRWGIVEDVIVDCRTLKSIFLEVGDYDFIKIDTQGSELDILEGAIGGGLEQALGVESEVEFIELYSGQPLFGDMCKFMTQNDFEFYDFVVEYRYGRKELNRKGQLAFADALFLRTPEFIRDRYIAGILSAEKVIKYMQICYVYNKVDLIQVISKYFEQDCAISAEAKELL